MSRSLEFDIIEEASGWRGEATYAGWTMYSNKAWATVEEARIDCEKQAKRLGCVAVFSGMQEEAPPVEGEVKMHHVEVPDDDCVPGDAFKQMGLVEEDDE